MTCRGIVGAGAHGRVVLEVWRAQHPDDEFLFLDDDERLHGTTVLGVPVRPLDGFACDAPDTELAVAIGDNARRLEMAERLASAGARFGRPTHPSAVVSPSASIGAGTVLFAGVIVNTSASIAEHVVLNTGVIVEHDCVVGRGASLSPGTRMGGRVRIGAEAFLSTGVTVGARAVVGERAVVGAGAVVVSDIPASTLAYGVPARPVATVDARFDVRRVL